MGRLGYRFHEGVFSRGGEVAPCPLPPSPISAPSDRHRLIFQRSISTKWHVSVLVFHQWSTSWFKLKTPDILRHEYRLQYLFECRISVIILTPINRGRRRHCQFCFTKDLGLTLAAKVCPDQQQAFKKVSNSQAVPSRETVLLPAQFCVRADSRHSEACL